METIDRVFEYLAITGIAPAGLSLAGAVIAAYVLLWKAR